MLIALALLVLWVAAVGLLYAEGLWGNLVRLVNVVLAGLLAMNFFEVLAGWLESLAESYRYLWDFVALWAIFAGALMVLRTATDFLSRYKVRFSVIVDRVGGAILAIWVGWVFVCFTAATLHTAPLARQFLFGSFRPEQRMFYLGLAPDRQWLAFTQSVSRGCFAQSSSAEGGDAQRQIFDPRGEFMSKYATRRAELESAVSGSGTPRVAH